MTMFQVLQDGILMPVLYIKQLLYYDTCNL